MGDRRGEYRVLVGRPKERDRFGITRHELEDNTKMDHKEIAWEDMDWIHLAQDRGRW
jgi:hypothetical protein